MARLRQLRPQVRNVRLAVKMIAPREVDRTLLREVPEDRSFYKTARWQRKRMDVLVRDLFTCQWPGCGVLMQDSSQLVADHIIPVRVRPDLKWDDANLHCLCKTCHDGPKQAQENATYGKGTSWKGRGG